MSNELNQSGSQSGLVWSYLGGVTILVGIITLLPLLVLPAFPEEVIYAKYFIIPGVIAILGGYLLRFLLQGKAVGSLEKKQAALIVVGAWVIAIFLGAMPFWLTGSYTLTQALFESTSGWTTTGLTVVDVSTAPRLFLLHRSSTHFFGGIGLVLVMVSILSDRRGMRLYTAEGHADRLLPNLLHSSRLILTIYAGIILVGFLLYILFGMPWFDALNHSIAAVATGGFSTQPDSIGHYHSFAIELITILLMVLGNISFFAHLQLLRGKFRLVGKYCEIRFTCFLLLVFVPLLAMLFFHTEASSWLESFRLALFQAVTAFSTTGFQTVPQFSALPQGAIFLLTLLMLIGGGTGSTAGGIKQFRVYVLLKNFIWSLRQKGSHKRVVQVEPIHWPNGEAFLDEKEKNEILTFASLFVCLFFLGTFILTCYGYPIGAAMFEFSAALSNSGVSCGVMTATATEGVLWTGTIGMFIGRLEIYVVFLALWRLVAALKRKNGVNKGVA